MKCFREDHLLLLAQAYAHLSYAGDVPSVSQQIEEWMKTMMAGNCFVGAILMISFHEEHIHYLNMAGVFLSMARNLNKLLNPASKKKYNICTQVVVIRIWKNFVKVDVTTLFLKFKIVKAEPSI